MCTQLSLNLRISCSTSSVTLNCTLTPVIKPIAVPQLSIRQMVDFYKAGNFAFDKLAKFYKFEDINKAAEESLSGKIIKPILIIDETYVPEN